MFPAYVSTLRWTCLTRDKCGSAQCKHQLGKSNIACMPSSHLFFTLPPANLPPGSNSSRETFDASALGALAPVGEKTNQQNESRGHKEKVGNKAERSGRGDWQGSGGMGTIAFVTNIPRSASASAAHAHTFPSPQLPSPPTSHPSTPDSPLLDQPALRSVSSEFRAHCRGTTRVSS